jgi:hypothetical protein
VKKPEPDDRHGVKLSFSRELHEKSAIPAGTITVPRRSTTMRMDDHRLDPLPSGAINSPFQPLNLKHTTQNCRFRNRTFTPGFATLVAGEYPVILHFR